MIINYLYDSLISFGETSLQVLEPCTCLGSNVDKVEGTARYIKIRIPKAKERAFIALANLWKSKEK